MKREFKKGDFVKFDNPHGSLGKLLDKTSHDDEKFYVEWVYGGGLKAVDNISIREIVHISEETYNSYNNGPSYPNEKKEKEKEKVPIYHTYMGFTEEELVGKIAFYSNKKVIITKVDIAKNEVTYDALGGMEFNETGRLSIVGPTVSEIPNYKQANQQRSVLNDWVTDLSLRMQGTLLTAIRGCDLAPKMPLDSTERTVTAFIRYAVMYPFDAREIDKEPGCFMQTKIPIDFKAQSYEHYPLHYVTHVMHALGIIGYFCTHKDTADAAMWCYIKLCKSLHLEPETKEHMIERLTEDRISKGSVVFDSEFFPEEVFKTGKKSHVTHMPDESGGGFIQTSNRKQEDK